MDFKYYRLVADVDFFMDKNNIGNYHINNDFRFEMKAINKYKDTIWDIQGFLNNVIVKDSFKILASITLYGVTYDDDFVVVRTTQLDV